MFLRTPCPVFTNQSSGNSPLMRFSSRRMHRHSARTTKDHGKPGSQRPRQPWVRGWSGQTSATQPVERRCWLPASLRASCIQKQRLLPVHLGTFVYFLELIFDERVKHATAKVYPCGIAITHLEAGCPFPVTCTVRLAASGFKRLSEIR